MNIFRVIRVALVLIRGFDFVQEPPEEVTFRVHSECCPNIMESDSNILSDRLSKSCFKKSCRDTCTRSDGVKKQPLCTQGWENCEKAHL